MPLAKRWVNVEAPADGAVVDTVCIGTITVASTSIPIEFTSP
ncbi:hypothetical protein [Muribaculum intestinale]|nr:hypothetical protein [Muribaculum intestinale]